VDLTKSEQLKKIATRHGISIADVLSELEKRSYFIQDLKAKGIRKNVEFAKQITNYYSETQFPKTVMQDSKVAA
jgi:4-aminobutyrate aminotransferase-like enzyme